MTNDARIAERVFSNPVEFPKLVKEGTLFELRRLGGDGLFTASDGEENWGIAHRILMPAFSRASIEKYTPEIIRSADKFLANLQSFYGKRRDIPLLDWTTKMAFDTIGICGS
jgi:cytochrome P450 / NADPH-cytochrome P450 reductase